MAFPGVERVLTVGSQASLLRRAEGAALGLRLGPTPSFQVLRVREPLQPTLQRPGFQNTHAVSLTGSLDPWLTLSCNSSVVQTFSFEKKRQLGTGWVSLSRGKH